MIHDNDYNTDNDNDNDNNSNTHSNANNNNDNDNRGWVALLVLLCLSNAASFVVYGVYCLCGLYTHVLCYMHTYIYIYIHIYIYIIDLTIVRTGSGETSDYTLYEEFARLAETRLAQNTQLKIPNIA